MNLKTHDYAVKAAKEVVSIVEMIDSDDLETAYKAVLEAGSVFVAGTGRSLLMLKAFAMRLMHFGHKAHVVGETTTPAILEQDILVIASGSGETESARVFASRAKAAGARLLVITANRDSSLAKAADELVVIPAKSKNDTSGMSWQPSGNSFEQSLLLALDGIAIAVAENGGVSLDERLKLHANLE